MIVCPAPEDFTVIMFDPVNTTVPDEYRVFDADTATMFCVCTVWEATPEIETVVAPAAVACESVMLFVPTRTNLEPVLT